MDAHKKLGLLEVFCIASGAMISSGLFVLPSLVYVDAGPGILISYFMAGVMVIPAVYSKAELTTAMPKSGGTYVFVDRSLGSLFGNFAGLANWLSTSLKGAFALIGMGAFLQLIYPETTFAHVRIVAVAMVAFFTLLNLISLKSSGHVQDMMVFLLLGILVAYIGFGYPHMDRTRLTPLVSPEGWTPIVAVAGTVFISYGGLTKVSSIAGDVHNPGRDIPRGMFLSFFVVNLIYLLTIAVTIGILPPTELTASLTPLSLGAVVSMGKVGGIALAIAAIFSFATTANASILAASRQPMAMAQDGLIPSWFGRTTKNQGTPVNAIVMTGVFTALVILALDLSSLVKMASTMMLILFVLSNLAVILMRESRIVSYKPSYKSPLYPYVQIFGIFTNSVLIAGMGTLPLVLTGAFFLLSTLWYFAYRGRSNKNRDSALVRIVERVTAKEIRTTTLHEELTALLLERDNIKEDRFSTVVRQAKILDIRDRVTREELFEQIAKALGGRFDLSWEAVFRKLEERERASTTVIHPTLAIPHVVLDKEGFDMVIVRAREGVSFSDPHQKIHMIFSLAGGAGERNFHLQSLMAIAQIVQTPRFEEQWLLAKDEGELKNLILLAERKR